MHARAPPTNSLQMGMIAPTPSDGSRAEERRAVRVLLAAKNWSQNDLAAALAVDAPTLSRLLSGRVHNPELWKQLWLVLTSSSEGSK